MEKPPSKFFEITRFVNLSFKLAHIDAIIANYMFLCFPNNELLRLVSQKDPFKLSEKQPYGLACYHLIL